MIRLSPKLFIISGAVGSGKSSRLMAWAANNQACGFITPVINNRKVLLDIRSGTFQPYELDRYSENAIEIGKYFLDKKAFDSGGNLLTQSLLLSHPLICIDEIGKLEMADQGFHESLTTFFPKFAAHPEAKAILVIRDYLLRPVIDKYKLI